MMCVNYRTVYRILQVSELRNKFTRYAYKPA